MAFQQGYIASIVLLVDLNRSTGAMNLMLSGRSKPVQQLLSRNDRAVLVAAEHVGSWPEGGDGALADQTDADLQGHMIRTRRHPWNNTRTNSCVVIEQRKQA